MTDAAEATTTTPRPQVDKALRPIYAEIARLSGTLGLARKACQEGNPQGVIDALDVLGMELPIAQKKASLFETRAE